MKTKENLEVVKEIPLDRIRFETDCPYCEIRKSHASHQFVKTHFKGKDKKKTFAKGPAGCTLNT